MVALGLPDTLFEELDERVQYSTFACTLAMRSIGNCFLPMDTLPWLTPLGTSAPLCCVLLMTSRDCVPIGSFLQTFLKTTFFLQFLLGSPRPSMWLIHFPIMSVRGAVVLSKPVVVSLIWFFTWTEQPSQSCLAAHNDWRNSLSINDASKQSLPASFARKWALFFLSFFCFKKIHFRSFRSMKIRFICPIVCTLFVNCAFVNGKRNRNLVRAVASIFCSFIPCLQPKASMWLVDDACRVPRVPCAEKSLKPATLTRCADVFSVFSSFFHLGFFRQENLTPTAWWSPIPSCAKLCIIWIWRVRWAPAIGKAV